MWKHLRKIPIFTMFIILPLIILSSLVMAAPAVAAPGLTVSNNIFMQDVQAGQTYIHKMTVTSGSSYPMQMQVEADGLGVDPNGTINAILPQNDTSPFSARTYITNIDNPSFNLAPGASQEVQVTISIPSNATPGERYACVYIYSQPGGEGNVGVIVSSVIPIIINIPGYTAEKTGQITDLTVPQATTANPIVIDTTFENTGNVRLPVQDNVTITDSSGKTVSQVVTPVTSPSVLPTLIRLFTVSSATLVNNNGLAPGQYSAQSVVILKDGSARDGTVLDSKSINFNVTAATASTTPTVTSLVNQANTTNPIVSQTNASNSISPVKPVTGPLGISWAWAGIIIGAILLIGILFVVIMTRRTSAKKE